MSDNILTCKAILEAIKKIETYSQEFENAEDFYHHELKFDATMMQFVIIGEMIVKIDEEFKAQYSQIPWQEIKDFRNLVAHNYFGIDSFEVWSIIKEHLPTFKNQIVAILQ
ncbi:MAG: hypothetical protein PWQ42_498 [Sulfurospirillum sp.]|jgi:uncharacterized protein with HEPN domain|nr:hypothetical protein [Sulfurospirillum sp.]